MHQLRISFLFTHVLLLTLVSEMLHAVYSQARSVLMVPMPLAGNELNDADGIHVSGMSMQAVMVHK